MMLKKTQIIIFLLMMIALMSVSVAANMDNDNSSTSKLSKDPLTTNRAQTIKYEKSMITTNNNKNINKETPSEQGLKTSNNNNYSNNITYTNTTPPGDERDTIIITPETFSEYITNGLINEKINNGTTLDFTGKFDGEQYAFTVNKPVNIVSSKNDAFLCFYSTQNLEQTYGTPNHSFLITKEGSGTNITGINFENTMIVTQKAYNVTFDNLTVYCSSDYGWGLGSPSIRNSENVTIKNSYFNTTEDNTWVSTIVFAASKNCLLENCTVTGSNFIGNLVYATTYNVELTDEYGNSNITIRGNRIIGKNLTPNIQTCYSICLIGDNMTVENNYIENSNSYLIMSQYHDDIYHADGTSRKLIIRNNSFGPGKIGVEFDPCIITNNTFYGTVKLDVLNTTIQENNTEKDANSNPYLIEEENTFHPTLVNITAPPSYIYDETSMFTVTVIDHKNNQKIREGYLEIYSDGKIYKNITISNETTTFTYNNPEIGEHHVRVWYYPHNNTILRSHKVHSITSEKIRGQLKLETKENPEIGETITLNVSYTLNKERNHQANITFNLPGQKTVTVEAVNNTATIETKITPEYIRDILGGREQSIKVSAITNDTNIEITPIIRKLGVQKETTSITITPTTAKIGEKTPVTAIINSRNNINKGSITFTDEQGNLISTVNVKNNQATTIMTYNTSTSHNITATYDGTIHFKNCDKTSSILVTKYDTILTSNSNIAKYGEKTSIIGKLTDENNQPIPNESITITINGANRTVVPNSNGEYTYTTILNKVGTNTVTIAYEGNMKYNPTSTTTLTTINKQDTQITINNIPTPNYQDNVTITGTLKDKNGNNIQNAKIKISINNKESTVTTNNQGIFTHTITAELTGTNNITTTYNGNNNYNSATSKATFTVNKQNTNVKINNIPNTKYGNNALITGTLNDEKQDPITDTITLTINNKQYNVKTDTQGTFTQTITTDTLGTNNIIVTYNGNTKYNTVTTKTIFKVEKQDTTLTLNNIQNVTYQDKVTITGTLKDNTGKTITYNNITLNINEKTVTTKTDTLGRFSYQYTANTVGTNNVTATYDGNTQYNPTSIKTIFVVAKQGIKITLDTIKAKYTDNITIKGKLTTQQDDTIGNSKTKLNINGKIVTVKIDEKGVFTYKYSAKAVGINNITITFPGNTQYKSSTTKKTFKVEKQDLKLTIDKIKRVAYLENITIRGVFKDKNGKILGNSKVKININGKNKYVKTNTKGVYTYTTRATKTGNITVTVSHNGNKNYNKVTTKQVVTIKKQDLKITANVTRKVGYGSKVYIKGKLTDKHDKIIKNTVINININGKIIRAKTNNKGIYNHSLTTTKLGTNNITIKYHGSKNYNKITKKITFTVIKQNVKIKITGTKQVTGTKKVTITGKLTTKDNKALINSQVTLTINGKNKTAKTNTHGVFKLTTTAKKGTNTLITSYKVNKYYNKFTGSKITFKIV